MDLKLYERIRLITYRARMEKMTKMPRSGIFELDVCAAPFSEITPNVDNEELNEQVLECQSN